jgi:hypothetical protein
MPISPWSAGLGRTSLLSQRLPPLSSRLGLFTFLLLTFYETDPILLKPDIKTIEHIESS